MSEHVGADNARKKTEGWAAASKTLREQRSQHLDLAYGNGERNKWDLYPASDPKAPCFVHIHGGLFAENFGVYGANGAMLVPRQRMTSVRSVFPRSLSE
jgi:hypothetical protein